MRSFILLSLLAALWFAAGCSTANTPGGESHIDASGKSVSGWMVVPSGGTHTSSATQEYIAGNGSISCTQCHGSDLSGGISKVSCFGNTAGCHHGPIAGWVAVPPASQNHGISAKKAPGSSGFASCQICHASDFSGGGADVSCFTCHGVSAPHPPKPWRGPLYTHANTDTANAPVCAQCHYANSPNNPANHPATPAPAGTAPGCFNNTLCHGEGGVPHPVDNTWVTTSPAPQPHGISAKAAPGTTSGFAYCKVCHGTGTNFAGGSSNVSCYPCHSTTTNSPHASQWRTGDPYVHTNTDAGNADVCAFCHTAGANSPIAAPIPAAPAGTAPGCFNSTLCHGAGVHPAGWSQSSQHGPAAKAAPAASAGFSYCQGCHGTGTNFAGGTSGQSCYPCHLPTANSPHASQWRTGDPLVHTSTATGNAPVCAFCHLNGALSPIAAPSPPAPAGTAPGCFNSTLCHGQAGHPAGWVAASPASQPHGVSAKATPGATAGYPYCQTCHGTGTNFSGGSSGISCYPCHLPTSNSPHASQWRTGDTYVHTTTAAGNATVCAYCHLNGALSPIAAPSPPAPAGTAPGCFNSTLCHGSGGVAHAVPYNADSHYLVTSATFPGSCGACHDVSAPSTKAGPVCQTCHVAASPLTALNCTSCHASPPNGGAPAGAAYANIAGVHAVHIALSSAGTPISCDTCHNGLGPSFANLNHYNRAKSRVSPGDAAFLATYNAKTGASSFDNSAALNCSNVSCHGGQATPNWQTGSINVNTQCTNCHASGTAQYNSYNSGEHQLHVVSEQLSCTVCHNTTTLAVNHFTNLSTTAMEGPASATIGGTGTGIVSWNPATKSCSPSCHGTQTW